MMDEIQRFIANNTHQLGYIMDEASRKWIEQDPKGALTVGASKGTLDTYGSYYDLLEKLACLEEGKNI
ncbi:hypothetical protein QRE66_27735 (plasmid) [Bacillus cereus]|nr:hypothetical protein QRE66_27735 [Bacillus cereus]